MHQGPDRIEFSPLLGRPIRQGDYQELSVSDRERILEALAAKDIDKLTAYWGYLHFGQQMMASLAYEWALRWQNEAGPAATAQGHAAFLASLVGPQEIDRGHIVATLLSGGEEVSTLLSNPTDSALAPHLARLEPCLQAAAQGDWVAAAQAFEEAFSCARWWHDLLFRHSWAIMSAILDQRGQAALEQAVQRVLTSASFYEPAWQQAGLLTPAQLAVVLAEHLRLHFSGPDGSAVQIIDEPDRIRLVLSPCGSGGAMRRAVRDRAGFSLLAESSVTTWGRSGQVPAYCSHCAVNEVESLRRFGHRKWVTEFDPDPDRPCGWTLYKQPDQ